MIHLQVSNFDSFKEAWLILEKTFALRTRIRNVEIKKELQNLSKKGLNIFEYVLKIKVLNDGLLSVGFPISKEEKLTYMLRGLGEVCDNFFIQLQRRC